MGGMYDIRTPNQSYMRSAGHLGWAFPAALGAKCGAPDRPVFSFTGFNFLLEINFIEFSPVNKNRILGLLGGMAGGYAGLLAVMFGGCMIASIVDDGNIYDNPIPGISGITVALIGARQGYIAGSNFGWGSQKRNSCFKSISAWSESL